MGRRAAGGLLLLGLLGGCSAIQGPEEYRTVRDLPPLALPAGAESRPIKPLYAIPAGPLPTSWPKKFEVPKPKPLAVAADVSAKPGAAGVSAVADHPVLTQDGNGYPLMSVSGDFNAVWDRLEEVLRRAGVKIDDRDQRVSLYYLRLRDESGKDSPFQLRVARAQSAFTLTLQKDDDTLAPQEMSRSLFEAIVKHWSEPDRQPPAGPPH